MLTVQSLLDELDLDLVAGSSAAESPVRWVHISELEDPTPWLSGGELMLTTGIPFDTASKQRAFSWSRSTSRSASTSSDSARSRTIAGAIVPPAPRSATRN